MPRKVIVSYGYGAGWSTWHSGNKDTQKIMAEWPPLVEAIEAEFQGNWVSHPAFMSLCDHIDAVPYTGGLHTAVIVEIPDGERYFIEEYDGAESLVTESDFEKRWM